MRPDYYQILELPEQASAAEIRRAYLRLVRITHPDRTPDPAAHQRYLLVNEAYDTLSKPDLRAYYDARLTVLRNPLQPAPPVYAQPFAGNAYQVLRVPYSATLLHIDQAYQRLHTMLRANTVDPALRQLLHDVEHAYATLRDPRLRIPHDARVRGQRPQRRPDPLASYYARYASWGRRVCWLVLVFFGLMLVDMVWTELLPLERVITVNNRVERVRREASYYLVRTTRTRFRSEIPFRTGERVDVWRSVIFHQVRSYLPSAEAHQTTKKPYSADMFYGTFLFFPLLMAGLAGVGAWPGATPKRTVDTAVAAALIIPIVLYLMLSA